MRQGYFWTVMVATTMMVLVSGCSTTRFYYSLIYRGYTVSPASSNSESGALRFDIDTTVWANGQLRMRITNISDKPLILHKRFANLARMDTVISKSPFEDDPYLEYSFSQSTSSDYSSSRGGYGASPYALTNEYLSTRSSGFGLSSSSASTITRKAISETILYPKQVVTFLLNDIVSSTFGSSVPFDITSANGGSNSVTISLSSSSLSREYINQGADVLREAFKEFGKQPVTLFLTYTDLSGEGYRTATFSYTFSELLVDVQSMRMN
ncbi:MAG: hypothetical protein ACK5H0_09090 [Bacteroidota bacterium]|jgi:hypothetical protein